MLVQIPAPKNMVRCSVVRCSVCLSVHVCVRAPTCVSVHLQVCGAHRLWGKIVCMCNVWCVVRLTYRAFNFVTADSGKTKQQ